MRKVEVSTYQEQWSSMFEEEANKLREVLGQQMVAIHHIGSTSVPRLKSQDYHRYYACR